MPATFMGPQLSTWLRKAFLSVRETGVSEAFLFRVVDMMLGGLEQTHEVADLVNTRNPYWNHFQGLKP